MLSTAQQRSCYCPTEHLIICTKEDKQTCGWSNRAQRLLPLGRRTLHHPKQTKQVPLTSSSASSLDLTHCPSAHMPHYWNEYRNILGLIYIKRPKIIHLLQLNVTVCSVGYKTDLAGSQSQQVGVNETASSRIHAPSRNLPTSGRRMQSVQDQVRGPEPRLSAHPRHCRWHHEEIPSVLALGTEGLALRKHSDKQLPGVLRA